MNANPTPYDRHLARQRKASKAYRANRRAARAPDMRDVGAVLLSRYVDRRADDEGNDAALVDALAERGFDREASRQVLEAAIDRARQARDDGSRPGA